MDWNEAVMENLPSILHGKTESRLHEILSAEPELDSWLSADPDLRDQLLRVAGLSPFAARIMSKRPELLRAIIQRGSEQPDSPSNRLHEYLTRYPVDTVQAHQMRKNATRIGLGLDG